MLYRYLRLREEQHFQRLSDLLLSGNLFLRQAARFNDPNEFRFQLRAPKEKAVIQKGWQQDHPNGTIEEFEAWFSTTNFEGWHLYHEPALHQEFCQRFGVACFSKTADNPTMWAHYADEHNGVCVGFADLSIDSFPGITMAGDVNYQAELPVVQYFGEEPQQVAHKIFFTKSADWGYEREFRLVADADTTLTMNPALVQEVILGMHMSESNRDRVRKIAACRGTSVSVRTAHLSYSKYEMDIS